MTTHQSILSDVRDALRWQSLMAELFRAPFIDDAQVRLAILREGADKLNTHRVRSGELDGVPVADIDSELYGPLDIRRML